MVRILAVVVLIFCLGAPGPVAADESVAVTTYVPSSAVRERVRARFIADLRGRNPGAADALAAAMQQQDFLALWSKAVAADGLRPDDAADATTSYWVLNWLIAHGETDNTQAQVQGTRRQVVAAMTKAAGFRALDDAGRQTLAEATIYQFVLQYAEYRAATGRHDQAALRRLGDEAEARMLREAKLDMRKLALTDQGLGPIETPAAPVASGEPLKIEDIDRVAVAHWFGITPTGLANTFDVYVLLRDGTVYRDPAAALSDLDVAASRAAEPGKWGSWREADGTVTFTWPAAKPAPRTERKRADELSRCRPAEPGLSLEGDYSHTGGSGPVIPGGIVTLSEADLRLTKDGRFGRDSATAVGGSAGGTSFGGGARGASGAGHYRLQGYDIAFDDGRGHTERRFFCRYTDDDTMIFVGTVPWMIRQR